MIVVGNYFSLTLLGPYHQCVDLCLPLITPGVSASLLYYQNRWRIAHKNSLTMCYTKLLTVIVITTLIWKVIKMFELTTILSVFAITYNNFQKRFRICVLIWAGQFNPLEVVDPSTQCYIDCVSNRVTCTANRVQPTLANVCSMFVTVLYTVKAGSSLCICKINQL